MIPHRTKHGIRRRTEPRGTWLPLPESVEERYQRKVLHRPLSAHHAAGVEAVAAAYQLAIDSDHADIVQVAHDPGLVEALLR